MLLILGWRYHCMAWYSQPILLHFHQNHRESILNQLNRFTTSFMWRTLHAAVLQKLCCSSYRDKQQLDDRSVKITLISIPGMASRFAWHHRPNTRVSIGYHWIRHLWSRRWLGATLEVLRDMKNWGAVASDIPPHFDIFRLVSVQELSVYPKHGLPLKQVATLGRTQIT